MLFLSFAMMVKNEGENLERCLSSVLPFSSEIVILDTGSTDNTVDIAKKFTDKIYHQKWQDDFSLHRNKSFSLANGEWIFQLDADEELILDNQGTAQQFLDYLAQLPLTIHAVAFPLRDYRPSTKTYTAEFDAARCFRRGKVVYHRKIHNRPDFEGSITYFDKMYIKHYGYDLTEEQQKIKAKRTIGLLLKSIQEDPNDYESHFYLCQAYKSMANDTEKSFIHGLKYLSMKDLIGKDFNMAIYHTLAAMYFEQEDMIQSAEMIKQGLAVNNKNPDLWFDTLKIAVKEKKMRTIATAAQNYISCIRELRKIRTESLGGQFFFHTCSDSVASGLYYLSMCYFENGVMELKNLKQILGFCTDKTRNEINARIDDDMKSMKLEDTSERRILIPV